MKISEATLESVKHCLRVDYSFDDDLITAIMESAKGKLMSDTALTAEELDEFPEMLMAFYMLCGDLYDNRSAAVSGNSKPNPSYEQIIALHRRNYI